MKQQNCTYNVQEGVTGSSKQNSIYNTVPRRLQLNYYEIYSLTQNQHHQVEEYSK